MRNVIGEFTPGEAARIAGISDQDLQNFMNYGLVEFRERPEGRRTRRYFTAADIPRLRLIGAVYASGFSPRVAMAIAALAEVAAEPGCPRFAAIRRKGQQYEQAYAHAHTPVGELFEQSGEPVFLIDLQEAQKAAEPIRATVVR